MNEEIFIELLVRSTAITASVADNQHVNFQLQLEYARKYEPKIRAYLIEKRKDAP